MAAVRVALALLALTLGAPGHAQSLESALSPGALARGHAKLEGECSKCHVRFDRAAQDRLCADCHKEVGEDLSARTGLHGRQAPQPCRSCHTEHRGPEMDIAPLVRKAFDHRQTDYALRGRHASADCAACHVPGRKFREAPSDCLGCHRKDDKHRGSLGVRCGDCHTEASWKEAKVDHDKTRFPLTGKHVDARCDSCHKTSVFSEAPRDCLGCHRKDDKHKARYGERCETCHGTTRWGAITFRHDTDTRFALRGKHREAKCDSCHTGFLYRDKAGTACIDCHRKDDKHQGALGTECAACHVERGWRETGKFDHDRSRFPLRGGHVKAECKACHQSPDFRSTPRECIGCHRKDDKHEATLGTDCAACHTDAHWKASRFDHSRTRFGLSAGHASPPLPCSACHRDLRSFRPTALECLACHRKDDKHAGQLGERCETCHTAASWRVARFDHSRARFVLTGGHLRPGCKDCHTTVRFRDTPRDCASCHQKNDKHKGRLGAACESCHNVRDWRLWSFDHARQTDYVLQGAHVRAACEGCHRAPAPAGRATAPLDRSCLACHRADDVHDGGFGPRCDQCHAPTEWRRVTNRTRSSRGPARGGTARAPVERRELS